MDGPVRESNLEIVGLRSTAQMYYETALPKGLSILQLYKRIALKAQEHLAIISTGQDVGDKMEAWVEEEPTDSVNIAPTHLPMASMISSSTCCPELRRLPDPLPREIRRQNAARENSPARALKPLRLVLPGESSSSRRP